MPVLYVENTKTNARFRVVSYNPETKVGVLIGALGAEFETNMDKERLQKNNYTVKQYADEDDPGIPGAQATA